MAITKIWNVQSSPGDTLEYISRDMKSDGKTLVFSGHCSTDWKTADLQMRAHRRRFGKDDGNLLFHGCVSFKKDEITSVRALQYGQEWMQKKFGNYQYFASVHVDTDKVHFNFAINAVGLNGKKYNDCNRTLAELRAWTDEMCEKYNLSVVIPKEMGKSYKEWMEEQKGTSWKQQTKKDIDETILQSSSYEGFLEQMRKRGYYIKHGENIKHIVFKKAERKGCRGSTLGAAYTESAIQDRIRYKEFQFEPSRIMLRRNRRKMKPLEKELRRLEYRRPTIATTIALGIHLLAGTKADQRRKVPPSQRRRWESKYDRRIRELSTQLFFVSQNNIESRTNITEQIMQMRKEFDEVSSLIKTAEGLANKNGNEEKREEVFALRGQLTQIRKEMKRYMQLIQTLDEIRERKIDLEISPHARSSSGTRQKIGEKESR